ncbi:MAG: acyltransferase family protein [Pseudomonadota bacterium]
MAQIRYRPEIDGLRSIAVMSVVLYHAGYALFGGGFVGVDVFFVISGYLITALIMREVRETGGFRFKRFYLRRVRRLFPALLCTASVSAVLGFLFFSTGAMVDFGASALAAVASVSNLYFWAEADYFAADAITKPLLHTWSLSVEEQFYFIWPALTVFALAKWRTPVVLLVIAALSAASIWLAEQWIVTDRDAAFYLLPARLGEMALGAALVWIEPLVRAQKRARWIKEVGAFAGLGLIAWPMFAFDHHTSFPGINALMPCAGTALFILFSSARFAGGALRWDGAVFVGKISYSVYLVHWPIIVFWVMVMEPEPTAVGKALIVFLSLALGWMQYHFIEQRFRFPAKERDFVGPKRPAPLLRRIWAMERFAPDSRFALRAAVAAIPLVGLSAAAVTTDGLGFRIPQERVSLSNDELRRATRNRFCKNFAPAGTFAGDNPDLVTCQNYRGKNNDIYIWGDSHAFHLAAGFARHYPAYNIHVIYRTGCVPHSGFGGFVRKFTGSAEQTRACKAHNKATYEKLMAQNPTNLIITSAKRSSPRHIAPAIRDMVDPLREQGHRVNVVADFIRPGRSLIRCRAIPAYVIDDKELDRRCDGVTAASLKELRYNRHLARLVPDLVPVNDLQCAHGGCKFYHRGEVLYRDAHHLNEIGSIYFVRKLKPRLDIGKRPRRSASRAKRVPKEG